MSEPNPTLKRWLVRRQAPLLAATVVVVLALCFIALWTRLTGTTPVHPEGWFIPGDLWGTQLAARAVAFGHLGQVYSSSTGLVTFPAITVVLAPAIELARALDWATPQPSATPIAGLTGWLPLMVITVASALPVLFAADALAETVGITGSRRFLLAGFEAIAVWNVVLWWGHPEDALAVAFLVWAAVAVFEGQWLRASWLCGIAIAFQPLVLLALPILAALVPQGHRLRCALRAALPSAVLLIGPLVCSWHATLHALVGQPNYPSVDHATPWTGISPTLAGHQVAAGPLRLVGLILVVLGGWFAARRITSSSTLVWLMALALSSRLVFEPVMVAYYLWPTLCLGLITAAARSWWRFVTGGVLCTIATVFGDAKWQGNWSWWAIETLIVALFLWSSWPGAQRTVEFVTVNHATEQYA